MKRVYLCILTLVVCLSGINAEASYDHYFTWKEKPNKTELKACIAEMGRIAEARKDILAGPNGPGSPVILDATHVDLNGRGDDENAPFVFPGRLGFNFCTTAGKPYDAVVTACLIAARDHFPSSILAIDSDGSWEDWQKGANLYSSVLGRPARNPLGGSVADNPSGIDNLSEGSLTALLVVACILLLVVIVELVVCVTLIFQFFSLFIRRIREIRERAVECTVLAGERMQVEKESQLLRKEAGEMIRRLNARLKYE